MWRPQLRDPSDEMVLEAAVNGRADALVTFNRRDFGDVPGAFSVEVLSPRHGLLRRPRHKPYLGGTLAEGGMQWVMPC